MKRNFSQHSAALRKPEVLVFFPALTVLAYWIGGENALLMLAVMVPVGIAILQPILRSTRAELDISSTPHLLGRLDETLRSLDGAGSATACVVLQIDDVDLIRRRHGRSALSDACTQQYERVKADLRLGDLITVQQGHSMAIILQPFEGIDSEAVFQICERLQKLVARPIELATVQLHMSISIGFCIATAQDNFSARCVLDAAHAACDEAVSRGSGTIRSYSSDMARRREARALLRGQLEAALDQGQIIAHYQPQFCAKTGVVTGLEALARWQHPERGCLPPSEFLPLIEAQDLSQRLGEVMLNHALAQMVDWDAQGIDVPTIAVNFSAPELRNPYLPDRILWTLDRFGLAPPRLTIEVLETVIAVSDRDVIARNIARLAEMGCGIDLDDFGTGHASITALRRFAVRRLKIDRSLISRLDSDQEQQRIVAAILSLAGSLGLSTLAEGVETAEEKAVLVGLGVQDLQGFALARPKPAEELGDWLRAYAEGLVTGASRAGAQN